MGCHTIIGLTGGIACGKTLVCHFFAKLGVKVFDADEIARELVQPEQAALQEIIDVFGVSVLNDEGGLNRSQLRQLIFQRPDLRKKLEAILHPRIYACMQQRAAELDKVNYCIFCVPLLIETQKTYMVNRVLVIDCELKLQQQRLHERDQSNAQEIEAILNAQIQRNKRLSYADDIIQNNKNLNTLEKKVTTLHQYYLHLSKINQKLFY